MHRRTFLIAATVGAAVPAHAADIAPGGALSPDSAQIGWEEFIARAQADAQRLVTDRSQAGQDAYLHAIAQHAARLGEVPPVEPRPFGPIYSFDMLRFAAPFAVIYWRMEPGGVYPAHNHPSTNVCTVCTAGAANVRNFNLPDAPPITEHDAAFDVIESGHEILEPGVVNFVTEHRNNVHWFEAGPDGAEGLDITTTYGAMQPFSFMRLSGGALEAPGVRRFSARWVGNDPRAASD
jgi:quercetin dioxygenase-like cupin family protein